MRDVNGTAAGGNTGQVVTATGTLPMADTPVAQDAGKSAVLVLTPTSG